MKAFIIFIDPEQVCTSGRASLVEKCVLSTIKFMSEPVDWRLCLMLKDALQIYYLGA